MCVLKIVLVGFWLIFLPIVLGDRLAKGISYQNIILSYVAGWIKMMAIFQILALPAIFLKTSLTMLTGIWSNLVVGLMLYLGWRNKDIYREIISAIEIKEW